MTPGRSSRAATLSRLLSITAAALVLTTVADSVQGESATGAPTTAVPVIVSHWTNLTSGLSSAPPPSWGWAAAYDGVVRKALAFGGCPVAVLTPCASETWSFSTTLGWTRLAMHPAPSARQGATMAYDPLLRLVVLFGGHSPSSILRDTWEWDPSGWSDATSRAGPAPPARYDANMVWDPAVGAIVLFGGSGCGPAFCRDTWEFNGTWAKVSTIHSPPARAWPGLAYDGSGRFVLLTSGQTTAAGGGYRGLRDTWAFNGTDWSQLHPSAAPPVADQPVICYDGVAHVVLYVGDHNGETWIYRAGDWFNLTSSSGVSPPPRGLPGIAMDLAGSFVLLFGGGGNGTALSDTWAWT